MSGEGVTTVERPRRRRNEKEIVNTTVIIPKAPEGSSFTFGFCEDRNATRRRKMEVLSLSISL